MNAQAVVTASKIGRKTTLSLRSKMSVIQELMLNVRSPLKAAMECLKRGDAKGAQSQLSRAWNPQYTSDIKTDQKMQGHVATQIAEYMQESEHRGKHPPQLVVDFLVTLRVMGGKQVYDYVAQNLHMADERTARDWAKKEALRTFLLGVHRQNFEILAELYEGIKLEKGITGDIPCMLAEDETSINSAYRHDPRTDSDCGTCGDNCKNGCLTIKECRKNKCEDPHSCEYNTDAVGMVFGDDATTYTRLCNYVKNRRVARQLRVIIVNPLHPDLPPIPVVLIGTCSTFTYEDYLVPQWRDVDKLFDEVFHKVGLRRIGHSSDGDSRRRKAFVHRSLSTNGSRFALEAEGFIYSGKVITTGGGLTLAILNMDEDYLHAMKKLWNAANHSTRILFLGPIKQVRLAMLRPWLEQVPKSAHGCNKTDCDRKGYKAMDVPSLMRLLTERALSNLEHVAAHGWEGMGAQPYLAGAIRLLRIIRLYASMFLDKSLTNQDRIRRAGIVTTYLRLWREWVRNMDGFELKENYLTREASQDAILSCHFVVLLTKLYRDYYPTMATVWHKCGSDCCECYFSSLGSFSMNKRTYNILEALQSTRAQLATQRALSRSHLKKNYRKTRPKPMWDNIPPPPAGIAPNPLDRPTDHEMKLLWEAGVKMGRAMAAEDGMRPDRGRGYPTWWTRPHNFDNKECAWQDEEDQLDVDNAEDGAEEDKPPGDEPDADGDDDDDEKGNGDDDDEKGDGVAQAFLLSVEASRDDEQKISQMMDCPGGVRRHKAQVLAELCGGGTTLSADREKRMHQTNAKARTVFEVALDAWEMNLGSDIAIEYEEKGEIVAWYGKVLTMRKLGGRGGKSWITYTDPVWLQKDRTKLGELFVTCFFYKRHGTSFPKVYKFNTVDFTPFKVTSIICPVKFTYNRNSKLHTLDPESDEIVAASLGGKTTWAPSKKTTDRAQTKRKEKT